MKKTAALVGAFLLPVLAFAQTAQSILGVIGGIINILTVIVVALALLFFLWGLAMYILNGPGEKADEGRKMMIYGIIALFVMISVWGIVRVLNNTLGVGAGGTAPIPGVLGGGVGGSGSGGFFNFGSSGSGGGFNIFGSF